ncbi:UNVERIFIED_CONTAM: UDP-N-acetylglucosamine transferase subunit ALG13 [Acetivibrio alkalicellulosi]
MIFICTGTQIFQFNRLLIELDNLIENKLITDEVFAQIGASTYKPKYYDYKQYLSPDEYEDKVNKSELIITHGGTGAIVKGLKAKKQIIAIPRQAKFKEHEDDHQFQIVDFFADEGYILKLIDVNLLGEQISKICEKPIDKIFKGQGNIISLIENFLINKI